MQCEICTQLKNDYGAAVSRLRVANEHLRRSRSGTVDAALNRRAVHHGLQMLIASEAEWKSHRAFHVECLSPVAPDAGIAFVS